MEREQVIEYLAGLNYAERQLLLAEVRDLDYEKTKEQSRKNKEAYLRQVEKRRAIGELMKQTVKVGDVVKCHGTNDGQGIREVMAVNEHGIEARKLERRMDRTTKPRRFFFIRAGYITQHSWDKVAKIFEPDEITISESY